MPSVASRELRNHTRSLLDRVAAGESITITVDGRAVALLGPLPQGTRWMPRAAFLKLIADHQADPELRDELRALAPDTTDDISIPSR